MNKDKNNNRSMSIKCAVVHQNQMWISSHLFNALFCFDYINHDLKYIGKFENQTMRDNLHRQIVTFGEKLFFIPIWGKGIDIYNIKTHKFENTINKDIITQRISLQITKEIVWLFPQNIKEPLYILNLKEQRIKEVYKWRKQIKQIFPYMETILVSAGGICKNDNRIYMCLYNNGIILDIDIENIEIRKIFHQEQYHFISMLHNNETLYLSEIGRTDIVQIQDGHIINRIQNNAEVTDFSYSYLVSLDNGFLIIPYQLNDLYFLDINTINIQKLNIYFEKRDGLEACFLNWQRYEENIVLYPGRSKEIVVINSKDLTGYGITLDIPEQFTNEWILRNRFDTYHRLEKRAINESEMSLKEFIEVVECTQSVSVREGKSIGEKIYAYS